MATQAFQIVTGPSREDLFDALRLVSEGRTVEFEWIRPDDVREKTNLKVLGIQAVGDELFSPKGGRSWMVHAIMTGEDMEGDRIVFLMYSTQSRTGTIDLCATDMVGPSPLPVDDIAREGFFALFIRDYGYVSVVLPVGPFETSEARNKFVCSWRNRANEEDEDVKIMETNAISGNCTILHPDHFTGFEMLPKPYEPPEQGDSEDR